MSTSSSTSSYRVAPEDWAGALGMFIDAVSSGRVAEMVAREDRVYSEPIADEHGLLVNQLESVTWTLVLDMRPGEECSGA